jgi:hypothetical protein
MITAMTPGTNNPCMNRQKMSAERLCAVAASSVGTAIAKSAGTMTFLRPMDSAIRPVTGARMATDSVTAPTVKLTCTSVA